METMKRKTHLWWAIKTPKGHVMLEDSLAPTKETCIDNFHYHEGFYPPWECGYTVCRVEIREKK